VTDCEKFCLPALALASLFFRGCACQVLAFGVEKRIAAYILKIILAGNFPVLAGFSPINHSEYLRSKT